MIKLFSATLTRTIPPIYEMTPQFKIFTLKITQRGARTHDPEIKSLMLYRLS